MSNSDETLILDQVKDLKRRIKSAIKSGSDSLTYSLKMEYADLLYNASIQSFVKGRLKLEFSSLTSEVKTIPPKSKDDSLAQLKWLDNSTSQLEMLIKRLIPASIKPELELHPKVLATSGKLLQDKHYPQAVFEAFKALEEYVREKSGRDEYGERVMSKVFDEDSPILKIKPSRPDTAKDEQKGFRFIFMGAMTGIRNPKGHHTIIQKDKTRTLQYLALASLLFKTVDEATLVLDTEIGGIYWPESSL